MQQAEGDAFDIIVESKAGRAMRGIDVSVICDGRTAHAGVTGAVGFKIECAEAPTHVLLGLSMYGVPSQTIEVAAQAGANKAYVFEFDAGDLGRKKFASQRFAIEDGTHLVDGLRRYADPGTGWPHLPLLPSVAGSFHGHPGLDDAGRAAHNHRERGPLVTDLTRSRTASSGCWAGLGFPG